MNPELADRFHAEYYGDGLPFKTSWRGVPMVKCPMDMWAYADIILSARPDVLIETGTYRGGSALFFADMMDLAGNGEVVTIDRARAGSVSHDRITYLSGDSAAMGAEMESYVGERSCMVVLDSDHHKSHVLAELEGMGCLVTSGQYLIVEDTNLGHQVCPDFLGDGPAEAIAEWLPAHPDFEVDATQERHGLTMNPGGWLRRR